MSAQDTPESVTGTANAAGAGATGRTAASGPGAVADPSGTAAVPPAAPAGADPEAVRQVWHTWPMPPGEDAGRRRRRRLIAGGAALGAVALLTGAGFAAKDVFAGYGAYRYVTPQQFKGLQARSDAPPVSSPHAHLSAYGTPADGTVMVVGYESAALNPSTVLDGTLKRESAFDVRLRTAHRVDAGPRGGVMACTAQPADSLPGRLPGLPGGVCVWADRSMVVTFQESTGGPEFPLGLDQLASDARAFRLLCERPT